MNERYLLKASTGGISFWSPRKGFVCDNILNYEVVLADGSIINANAEEHADLWLALKGGSSNFGIVTRFDIRTFPQGDIWGGTIIYDISTAALQFEAFSNFISSNDYDEYAELIQNYAFIGRTGFQFAVNSIEYTKPVENPLVFQPFTKIQSQFSNSMRITNLTDITDEQASSGPKGARWDSLILIDPELDWLLQLKTNIHDHHFQEWSFTLECRGRHVERLYPPGEVDRRNCVRCHIPSPSSRHHVQIQQSWGQLAGFGSFRRPSSPLPCDSDMELLSRRRGGLASRTSPDRANRSSGANERPLQPVQISQLCTCWSESFCRIWQRHARQAQGRGEKVWSFRPFYSGYVRRLQSPWCLKVCLRKTWLFANTAVNQFH